MEKELERPAEGTFGATEWLARNDLAKIEESVTELELFAIAGGAAFRHAIDLVISEGGCDEWGHNFVRLLVFFERVEEFPQATSARIWERWPRSTATFGEFYRASRSSFELCLNVAHTVLNVCNNSLIATLRKFPSGLTDLPREGSEQWIEHARNKLRTDFFDFGSWPKRLIRRDADKLVYDAEQEFEAVKRAWEEDDKKTAASEDSDRCDEIGDSDCSVIDACQIPREFRSKRMSKKEAMIFAKPPAHFNLRQQREWFNASIKDGSYRVHKINRKAWFFDIRDFPEEARKEMRQI